MVLPTGNAICVSNHVQKEVILLEISSIALSLTFKKNFDWDMDWSLDVNLPGLFDSELGLVANIWETLSPL